MNKDFETFKEILCHMPIGKLVDNRQFEEILADQDVNKNIFLQYYDRYDSKRMSLYSMRGSVIEFFFLEEKYGRYCLIKEDFNKEYWSCGIRYFDGNECRLFIDSLGTLYQESENGIEKFSDSIDDLVYQYYENNILLEKGDEVITVGIGDDEQLNQIRNKFNINHGKLNNELEFLILDQIKFFKYKHPFSNEYVIHILFSSELKNTVISLLSREE